jgi:SAM-dependent methyltransferase
MADAPMTWEDAVRWLRAQPDRAQLVRDCYLDADTAEAAGRYRAGVEWAEVRRHAGPRPPGGRALDLGAGNGIVSAALAADGWAVAAVEPDPSGTVGAGAVAALASSSGLPVSAVRAVGERLPFADGAFDLVVARQVMHHAADLEGFAREAARVLRPGGRFLALRDHVVDARADLDRFLAAHPLHALYGGENAFEPERYAAAYRAAGLRVDAVLRSFDSPVNYAPHTPATIAGEIAARLPGGGAAARPLAALLASPAGRGLLRLLSAVDRRPGRLFSYVCVKPAAG